MNHLQLLLMLGRHLMPRGEATSTSFVPCECRTGLAFEIVFTLSGGAQ